MATRAGQFRLPRAACSAACARPGPRCSAPAASRAAAGGTAAASARPAAPAQLLLIDSLIGGLPQPADRARPRGQRARLQRGGRRPSRRRCAAASRRSSRCACRNWSTPSAAPPGGASRSGWNSSSACRSTAGSRPSSRRCGWPPGRGRRHRHPHDDLQRPHAAAPRRGNARRLHRQCQPRIAHAAGRLARLHRDLAGTGQGRSGRAREVSRHHAGPGRAHGAPDRRSAVAVAHRAQRPSAAQYGRSIWRRSCARWPTACRCWRATAASTSRSTRRPSR